MGLNKTQDFIDRNVKAFLIITDMNGNQQVHDPMEMQSNRSLRIGLITDELLEKLFDAVTQSNTDITIFEVEFTVMFAQNTVTFGNGNPKIPPYVNKQYIKTWMPQTYKNVPLNCAAYAIAYKMTTKGNRRYNNIAKLAKKLMERFNWTVDVSVADILKIVEIYKEYRITVIYLLQYNQIDRTNEGIDYKFELLPTGHLSPACHEKTIYLVYDPDNKHYGCASPNQVFQSKNRIFCQTCVSAFTRYSKCNCSPELCLRKTREYPKIKCKYCSLIKCKGIGCFRDCRFCGLTFPKGYDENQGHRCIIYKKPSIQKVNEGDGEGAYKLWVYDIEAAIKRTTSRKSFKFEMEDNAFKLVEGKVQTTLIESHDQKVNLVVFRDVFDDSSEQVYFGDDCLERFIEQMMILNDGKNIVIAHNGSGYDTRLIFETLLKMGQRYKPKIITRGSKIMQLTIHDVVFKDSLLFLPSSLSNLAKSFDLPIRKGVFPHLFNSFENYDYVGPLPAKHYFDLKFSAKNQKDVDTFNEWYERRSAAPWDFKHELLEYCRDDVKILGLIVKLFHEICVGKFEISPWFSTTAPAYVHSTVIQILSDAIDLPGDQHEKSQMLEELSSKHWVELKAEEYWFARRALRGGRTDVRKLRHVLTDEERARGMKIKYVDVVSMYPAVQVQYSYPVGVPTIHVYDSAFYPCRKHANPSTGNYSPLKCDCGLEEKMYKHDKKLVIEEHFENPSDEFLETFFGFICVSCDPPKDLYHPVLVTWDHVKNKCVATLNPIVEEVFTSVEFQVALKLGYKITKLHRIDVYNHDEGLWNDFIKDLYIEKLANSGPPPDSVEEQERLINAYNEEFDMEDAVQSSFPRWKYDGAMRSVFKTLLNCGWGKHCQRPNMDQTFVVNAETEIDTLFDNVQTGVHKVQKISDLGDNYFQVRVKNTSFKNLNSHNAYLPAGCFVPAYGRLTLFKYLHKLGERVLYHDTDSIIYLYDPALENIPESDIWGSWDEEKISKKGIDAFVSLGPKSYAIKAGDEEVVKLKGLSVKYAHRNMVNFDTISNCIDEHLKNNYPSIQIPQLNFHYKPGTGMNVATSLKILKFSPDNLKGVLHPNLKVYPEGFIHSHV